MKTETINCLLRYFEALHSINRNTITLCGVDAYLTNFDYEKILLEIVSNITRVIPISYNNSNKKLILKDSDGILSLKDDFDNFKEDIKLLVKCNYDLLDDLRLIRNKYQHSVHLITVPSLLTTNKSLFTLGIDLGDKHITFHLGSLIYLLRDLNIVMNKILVKVREYKTEKENTNHYSPYLDRITFMSFEDYNIIFDLEPRILIAIGKSTIGF